MMAGRCPWAIRGRLTIAVPWPYIAWNGPAGVMYRVGAGRAHGPRIRPIIPSYLQKSLNRV
jgi:hypothetical protein